MNITDVAVTLLPLGVATFTITVTVDPAFQGGTITNTATATPGEHTLCAADPTAATLLGRGPGDVTPNPALLTITKSHTPTKPSPGGGSTDHLHGDGDQPQQLDDRPRHARRSGPGADRRRRGLDDARPGVRAPRRRRPVHQRASPPVSPWSSPRVAR